MGLIYVNPEGPAGHPDALASARDIRETFGRVAMNDEETVALIVGGHTVGKTHGAVDASHIGPEPEGAPIEQQGLGWRNAYGSGMGADTLTSGLEGAWTAAPTTWDNGYLDNLFNYDWELTTSPAGAKQWTPKNESARDTVPDAHDPAKRHAPIMLTSDLALKVDPIYAPIAKRFHENPAQLEEAFAKAWFKLLHRDMGPISRYLGPWIPAPQLWQDPVPAADHGLITDEDVAALKATLLASGLPASQLIATAWASAASFRSTDKRGGANGARIRLAPQKDWEANDPAELAHVLPVLEQVRRDFNAAQSGGNQGLPRRSDRIGRMRGHRAGSEERWTRRHRPVYARPHRRIARTDVDSFAVLEPRADGFRNYQGVTEKLPPEVALVDRAFMLNLSAPEMTVLIGGLRVLNNNVGKSGHGVFTDRPGTLTNDFFVNLLSMNTEWSPSTSTDGVYDGRDRASGQVTWTATAVDLVFGSHSQLRALSEVYATADAKDKFVRDLVTTSTR